MLGEETGSRPVVAVAGCVAQQEGETLLEQDERPRHRRPHRHAEPEAAADAGPGAEAPTEARMRDIGSLPASISNPLRRRSLSAGRRAARASRTRPTSPSSRAATSSAPSASSRTRAATSGCGRSRDIVAEVRQAADTGAREVQLLGQIVNHYQAPDDPLRLRGAAVARQRRRRESSGSASRARIRVTSRRG